MLEFDHLFVVTQPQAPEVDALLQLGFVEGSRNRHEGQGTANRRIFFSNAMVEFLWVAAPAETTTAAIAPMQFLARANYRQSGYSPLGIGLRYAPDTPAAAKTLPFTTWAFRPPYLPPQLQFEVAYGQPYEPLIFVMPFAGTRPDALPPPKRQPLDHGNGARTITTVQLTLPAGQPLSPALLTLQELGLVQLAAGAAPLATVELDAARQHQRADLRPQLPLVLHY